MILINKKQRDEDPFIEKREDSLFITPSSGIPPLPPPPPPDTPQTALKLLSRSIHLSTEKAQDNDSILERNIGGLVGSKIMIEENKNSVIETPSGVLRKLSRFHSVSQLLHLFPFSFLYFVRFLYFLFPFLHDFFLPM